MMNRYPGPRSFTGDDRHLFFGRETEKQELFRLIVLNDIVVLFGESGTGKTSLLQAGVCPDLEERRYKPAFIRLNNTAEAPELQVCRQLKDGGYIPADMPEDRTLWEYFSRFWYVDLGEVFTPVVVFDQFEELFTLYKPEQRRQFIAQFAAIANGRPPAGLPADAARPPQAKFVFSIRSDFLYLLDELSADIPAILRCRFQLRLLDSERAADAIVRPAGMEGDYASPPFAYSAAALGGILESLGRHEAEGHLQADHPAAVLEIAAFQLQLVCRRLEEKIIHENHPEGYVIEPGFYGGAGGIKKIIDDFYNEVILKVSPAEREAAEKLLARGLIRNGRRIMMEESAMRDEYGVPQAALDLLHEERLLKREARKGELYYEISHDTLVKPVLERFKKIEEAEKERLAREEAERLRLEREKVAAARRRNLIVGIAAFVLLGFAFWQMYAAGKAREQAAIEQENAAEQQRKAEEATGKATAAEEEAKRQQRIAELEKQNALSLAEKAELAELKAQSEQARAAEATMEVAAKSKSLVQNLLKQAGEDFYRLQYEEALKKIRDAEDIGFEEPAVARAFMEIAYWYAETGRTDTARTTAATAARLLGRNDLAAAAGNAAGREALRSALELMDPARFEFLEARYFPDFVHIPGGEFAMGDSEYRTRLSGFQMARTETTFWQFAIFAQAIGLDIQSFTEVWTHPDHPIVNVTWYDAARYANWLSAREGLRPAYVFNGDDFVEIDYGANGYRLPTEAQWEYAARSGGKDEVFAGFSDESELYLYANFCDVNCENDWKDAAQNDGYKFTAPVGSYRPNGLGLYDMSGNVWEWCQDWYGDYKPEDQTDPVGPDEGAYRVLRGGSWNDDAQICRAALRVYYWPGYRNDNLGFRLVRPF